MPDILNTNLTTSVLLTTGAAGNDTIETAGDQDWWKVSLNSGTTYQFRLTGSSLSNPHLSLLNPNSGSNTLISADDNSAGYFNSRIFYTATSTADYFLQAQGVATDVGNYAITAIAAANVTTGTAAAPVANNGGVGAVYEQDLWKVTLNANTTYELGLTKTGATPLGNPYLSLLDSSFNLIAGDDSSGGSSNARMFYTPSATATYYLLAQDYARATGDYNLTVSTRTASAVTVGTPGSPVSNNGGIGLPSEQDLWKVTLNAGTVYDLRLLGNGLSDPHLTLMDSAGAMIRADDDSGGSRNALITYTPSSTGTYYLMAKGYSGTIGDYILTATPRAAAGGDVAGAGPGTALAIGGSADSTIDTATDQDWWSVALTGGTTYAFQMVTDTDLAANARLADTYLRLLNSGGNLVTFNDDIDSTLLGNGSTNTNSLITFTPSANGTYYLSAQGFNGMTGGYTISAATVAAASTDNAGVDAGSAIALAAGTPQDSNIDTAGDTDWWTINLTAGNVYQFELNGQLVNGSTLSDPTLRLLNTAGGEITRNDDGGTGMNSLITYVPTTTGAHYLVASGFGTLTGGYRISATDGGAVTDIVGAAVGTNPVLAVDGAAGTSTIGRAGDNDWWKVTLTGGSQYRFQLNGTTLSDPYLRLMDANGVEIAADDDSGSGLNSQITYTAGANGDYYLSAQGFGSDTGDYSLTAATQTAPADILATSATTASITLDSPTGVTSTIGIAGDSDWWKVSLTQGTQYRFSATGVATGGGLSDPNLILRNGAGAQVAADNDGGEGLNAQITFTAATTGFHYLDVQGTGVTTGNYTLTAMTTVAPEAAGADIVATTATTSTVTANDTGVTSAIGTAGDSDWWKVSLVQGAQYRFSASGVASGGGLADAELTLRDGAGAQIAYDDDSADGLNAQITFTATTTGIHYLDVQGSGGTGNYTLLAVTL